MLKPNDKIVLTKDIKAFCCNTILKAGTRIKLLKRTNKRRQRWFCKPLDDFGYHNIPIREDEWKYLEAFYEKIYCKKCNDITDHIKVSVEKYKDIQFICDNCLLME